MKKRFALFLLYAAVAVVFTAPVMPVAAAPRVDQSIFKNTNATRLVVSTAPVQQPVMVPGVAVSSPSVTVPAFNIKPATWTVMPPPAPAYKPFYIYSDNKIQNHYYPSGWMGDTQDLKVSGAYHDEPRLGKTCLRVTYLAKGPKDWAGIYWQNPPNNWGNAKGGYNLRGATRLTFWAKGQNGGERLNEVKIGGLSGKYPDSDVAWIGPLSLKKQWTQYTIPLADKDLRYINGGFCFTLLSSDNPHGCTFYLTEIRYE